MPVVIKDNKNVIIAKPNPEKFPLWIEIGDKKYKLVLTKEKKLILN
jgi:hypothetical protein